VVSLRGDAGGFTAPAEIVLVQKLFHADRAVGPPAPALADSRKAPAVVVQSTLWGERAERPARLEQEGFHVALEPHCRHEIGEVEGPGRTSGNDDEAHARRARLLIANDREFFLVLVAAHERPRELAHGEGIG